MESLFRLNDGRVLAYEIYGPADGLPVLYLHGTPSSRLEPLLVENYKLSLFGLLKEAGLKLIAVDRPGMGFSSYHPKGTFLSFASDLAQLCLHLKTGACRIMAWSGGGPYSLVFAAKCPELVHSVHIIAGFSRPFDAELLRQMGFNKWYFKIARTAPFLQRMIMNMIRNKKVRRRIPKKWTGLSEEDYRLIEDPSRLEAMAEITFREACRNGARGPVHEARSYYKDFGIQLTDISRPVHYWWGTKDMSVVRLHAEEVERGIPGAKLYYRSGEGHLSIYINCIKEILETISRGG